MVKVCGIPRSRAGGGVAQERGEVVGAVAVALDEARDVAHGADGFIGDVFDLDEILAGLRGIAIRCEDVLRDERDAAEAAEAAADLVMQVLRDLLAQQFHFDSARAALPQRVEQHGGQCRSTRSAQHPPADDRQPAADRDFA